MVSKLSSGVKGAVNELKACIWLLEQGYEVYRNVTPHGNFDLIVMKNDELIKIDVTCANYGNRCCARGKESKAHGNGGKLLYALSDGTFIWSA